MEQITPRVSAATGLFQSVDLLNEFEICGADPNVTSRRAGGPIFSSEAGDFPFFPVFCFAFVSPAENFGLFLVFILLAFVAIPT